MSRACRYFLSPIEDIESEISEIPQENLGNLIIRKKNIKVKVQDSVQKLSKYQEIMLG